MDVNEATIIQNKNKMVLFNEQEMKIFLKYFVEDAINFHAAMLKDFDELGMDLPDDFEYNEAKKEFLSCPTLFKKMKELGIDTKGLEDLK